MGNSARRDARDLETAEREREACELRKKGYSLQRIADEMGLADRATVHNIIRRAIKNHPVEAVEELRAYALERLDDATVVLWPLVLTHDLDAVEKWLKIEARRAALCGLDRAKETKTEMVFGLDGGPTPGAAAAIMREIFGGVTPPSDKSSPCADDEAGELPGCAEAPRGSPVE